MRFIKVGSQAEASEILLDEVTNIIDSNSKILWIVSGGSNVTLFAEAFHKLSPLQLSKVTILLSDERYGEVDHVDSNYLELEDAGVDFRTVKNVPVLSKPKQDFDTTVANYNDALTNAFNDSDFIFAQIGIGADGHTLGILPNSPVSSEAEDYVVGYKGADFERITMSFAALKKVNKVLVFCLGNDKTDAIMNLSTKDLSLKEQPAQIFKQLKETYIINRVIGDEK